MKRRLLMLLVALTALTGARAVNYNLFLCGTQVTSDNAADLSVIDGVTGTVSYNATSNTLTLENATLSYATGHAIQSTLDGVTIAVTGTNTVTSTYSKGYGLNIQGTGLTITGSGALSILS
ncbi:MAG: 50S ribosomal protein L7/L12, partial [Bacteroidaceae bacterium]|nr:50S ribosomal protein L7/L12 [Bacteroidaceae bacterium]